MIVLVLMAGSGVVGFFLGAAWTGAETIGQGIVDDFASEFEGEFDDGFDFDGGNGGPTTAGPAVRVGETVQGSLSGDAATEHPLTIENAADLTIELRSDDFDTTLTLLDENGDELAYNDDIEFGEDRNSRVEVSLEPGSYSIVVDAFGLAEGDYELEVR